jgi:hypothetical protein
MGLIASSELPGYKLLRERICNALDRCKELQDIDFKESKPWDELKWKIIKTAIAMGNLRDGGIIIMGVSERDDTWQLTGISQEHLKTFDVDVLTDQVNAYISPHVDLTLVIEEKYSKNQKFLAIQVSEFSDTPLVCKKNGPDGKDLVKGTVYIRSFGKPETTKVTTAEQMHDLLELAAEKRARRILEVSRRIGLVPRASSIELFDKELQDLDTQLPLPILQTPHWRVNLRPEYYDYELIPSLSECFKLVEQNRVRLRGWFYPYLNSDREKRAQESNWIASWEDIVFMEYWRLYQSAQFLHLFRILEATSSESRERLESWKKQLLTKSTNIDWSSVSGFISITNCVYNVTQIFEFAARLCNHGTYSGTITIAISLNNVKNFVLAAEPGRLGFKYCKANEDVLEHSWTVQSDVLVANSAEEALKAIVWFMERFGWFNPSLEVFKKDQQELLQRQI